MANKHGDFIWYELLTSDQDAARAFYEAVVGWKIDTSSVDGDMDYRMICAADGPVAGSMKLSDDMQKGGARPCWLGYICVDDVDAAAVKAVGLGGAVHMEPDDVEGVGRMAFLQDPQGAMFYVMKGESDEESHSFAATVPKDGHCAWNELMTSDPAAAKTFYSELFGWTKDGAMDMGPLGEYEFLRASEASFMLGAVMPQMPDAPFTAWSYYFRVPEIDVAAAAIIANGGQILQEPNEIPGGEYIVSAMDPQGAAFALIGKRG